MTTALSDNRSDSRLENANGASGPGEDWEQVISLLSPQVQVQLRREEPMRKWTSLRVGGPADWFLNATDPDTLAEVALIAQQYKLPHIVLGEGSNMCVSDDGVRGLVLRNACTSAEVGPMTRVDAGHNFMRLFVKTMQAGLSGLEFAVGIPGTVGGALVSNAGAYRGEICELVQEIDVVEGGRRKTVGPEWMGFEYRNSRLRRGGELPATLISATLRLTPASKTAIRLKAKDLQMQRILKQPWEPSAGSWFKNVNHPELAASLPGLPKLLKDLGKIPAAFLSEACGCKGLTIGRAAISPKHANFVVNLGGATATEVKTVAQTVQQRVWERFGVCLEEEVMQVGDWAAFVAAHPAPCVNV